jgi:hypothetical protein
MYALERRSSRVATDNLVWTSFTVSGTLPVGSSASYHSACGHLNQKNPYLLFLTLW